MLAGFVKGNGKTPDELPRLSLEKAYEVLKKWSLYEGKGIRRKTLIAKIENAVAKSGIQTQLTFGEKIQRIRSYSLRKYFRSNLTGHAPNEYIEA